MDLDLYFQLCSYQNLFLAYKKARKGKTQKPYVLEFETDLIENILLLQNELRFHTYRPQPLQEFILRDPKTRTIHRSAFRDRIVHHAICNVIEPIFEKTFIFDSYANRIGKGAFKAIDRFSEFQRKVSYNNTKPAYVLKADIRKYFEYVDHTILLNILSRKISDKRVLWLIKTILSNYRSNAGGVGMPLGNLTSQFFANVYLNELDQFVKHTLKAKYYLRYVDDFVILEPSRTTLGGYKQRINLFLSEKLKLMLPSEKSKILPLQNGVEFLGMRLFPHHRQLKAKNLRKFKQKLAAFYDPYSSGGVEYDPIYDFMEGWIAYAKNANTFNRRMKIIEDFEKRFSPEISTKEVNKTRKARQQHVRQIIKEVKHQEK